MTLTHRSLMLLAAGGSAALLAAAFAFQAMGWAPCQLCLWQRWPHAAAALIGVASLLMPARVLAGLGGLAAATATGLAIYHTGVERIWWLGPSSCTGSGGLGDLSGAALLPGAATEAPALVLCDTVTPFFLGLTMANWNALASGALTLIWVAAWMRRGA